MKVITAPNIYVEHGVSVFLAGGITGCSQWQQRAISFFKYSPDLREKIFGEHTYILNPRRKDFDLENHDLSEEQIRWEFHHITRADVMMFWFPKETLCPIALFELGKVLNMNKPFLVGADKSYKRRFDLQIQLNLATGTEFTIYNCLETLTRRTIHIAREIYWSKNEHSSTIAR